MLIYNRLGETFRTTYSTEGGLNTNELFMLSQARTWMSEHDFMLNEHQSWLSEHSFMLSQARIWISEHAFMMGTEKHILEILSLTL